MATPRADLMTEPLVVGQFYLVPTVRAPWFGKVADWPVIGPEHDDREILGFRHRHYHVDARFLPAKSKRVLSTLGHPLHAKRHGDLPLGPLPRPIWRRRKCIRATVGGFHPWHTTLDKLRAHYAGQQCLKGKGGWICPHQKAALGSIVPVNGVIICPLHGLYIDAATGVCLERRESARVDLREIEGPAS
jgi:hypothetical protein